FEGVAGGGMVKVTVSGQREVVLVNLDEAVVYPEDIEMLQDLIVIATNEALKKVEEKTNSTMGKFTQGLNLPFFEVIICTTQNQYLN
uniref:YbaB/EbfC family nucleoid-associated protein n=1 Tax=Bacillus velezensis TaxID=492670 RepID=UPI00201C4E0D